MSVTTLAPHTAPIAIDLQNGIAADPTARPTAGVVARAGTMTDTNADVYGDSVERISPRRGETGTRAEIVALLGAGFAENTSAESHNAR